MFAGNFHVRDKISALTPQCQLYVWEFSNLVPLMPASSSIG